MRIRKRPAKAAGEPTVVVGSMKKDLPVKRILLGLLVLAVLAAGAFAVWKFVIHKGPSVKKVTYSTQDQAKDFAAIDQNISKGVCKEVTTKLDAFVKAGKQPQMAFAEVRQGKCLILDQKYSEAVTKLTPAVANLKLYTFENSANVVLDAQGSLTRAQQEVRIMEGSKTRTNKVNPNPEGRPLL